MADDIILSVGIGALGGILYGLTGFVKELKKSQSDGGSLEFDWISIGSTVIGSGIIGGIASYQGLPFDNVSSGAIGVLVTQYIKKLLKVIT